MSSHEEKIERWLDDALADYGRAEPRIGIEGRVLARLSLEQERSHRSLWWGACALASAALVVVVAWWSGHPGRKQVSESPVARLQVKAPESGRGVRSVGTNQGRAVQRRRESTGKANRGTAPRQEQFPSPSPLTDQEKMLARYVRDFPEKAALVARAQTEFHRQNELEMAAPWLAPKAGAQ